MTAFKKFPEGAPYSRDKLQFAHNYIEEIIKWRVDAAKKLKELLDGEQDNYDAALAMEDSFNRDEALSHSWGRIKLLKQLLEALEQ